MVINITDSSIDKLHAFVGQHLPPKKLESKMFGEVFTPLTLVDEMLTAVEKYGNTNIWNNPKLKILDPAAGIGNFPLIAYQKLMKGLARKIPNEDKRCKHILENMLYMVELNPINVRLMKKIFKAKTYKLNILCTDFLPQNKDDIQKHKSLSKKQQLDCLTLLKWKELKFDMIIGNPPFQAKQEAEGKRGGGEQIWDDFVNISLDTLNKHGFLVFVHPSGWRKPESNKSKYKGMYKRMTRDNQMHYLEIHSTDDGKKTFQSGTRYDWYVIQNHKSVVSTTVVDEQGVKVKMNLMKTPWLPNYNFSSVFSLLAKRNEPKCEVIFSRSAYGSNKDWVKDSEWINNNKSAAKSYQKVLIHSTPKEGTRYMWTNDLTKDKQKNVPMFGVSKVIFGDSGVYNPIQDSLGEYGMTQHSMAIATKQNELQSLANFMTSKEFQEILNACQWSNYMLDWRLFTYFKADFWKQQNHRTKAVSLKSMKNKVPVRKATF